jgi:hypothetical protein
MTLSRLTTLTGWWSGWSAQAGRVAKGSIPDVAGRLITLVVWLNMSLSALLGAPRFSMDRPILALMVPYRKHKRLV